MVEIDLSNTARVERFFKQHPNKVHLIGNIASATGLNLDQVRGAISYLRAKAATAGKAIEIRIVTRGKSWQYVPEPKKPVVRKAGEPMPQAQVADTDQASRSRGKRNFAGWCDVPNPCKNKTGNGVRHEKKPDCGPMFTGLGTAQFNRMIDALGEAEAAEGRAVLAKEIRLRLVGTTPDGYAIGVDDGTGNTFKVVPV